VKDFDLLTVVCVYVCFIMPIGSLHWLLIGFRDVGIALNKLRQMNASLQGWDLWTKQLET